jgi:hypothetical protein
MISKSPAEILFCSPLVPEIPKKIIVEFDKLIMKSIRNFAAFSSLS